MRRGPVLASVVLGALLACESYEPAALGDDVELVRARDAFAENLAPDQPFTLARAAAWLRARGPRVRDALADYRTALARARIRTPWPNPVLEIGPAFGFGPGVDVNKVVPLGSLGLTIPISGRLGRRDELELARAQQARAAALALYRELYLELRAGYTRLAVARARRAVRASLLSATDDSLEVATALVDAGVATALDVSLFQLEKARERVRGLTAELAVANAEAELSTLLAVDAAAFGELPAEPLARVADRPPPVAELRRALLDEHPELFRLRAGYQVAECELHLEITRQYPDIGLGGDLGGEVGERITVLGLSLGIELPIFDRNQRAIAGARRRREQLRTEYESAAHRALSTLEYAHRAVTLATARHEILRADVLPTAEANVAVAHRSLAAGSAGALQVLDAERSLRQVRIEVLEAQLAEQLAWSRLEQAVGAPLVEFPSDPAAAGRRPPDELEPPGGKR